MLTNPSLLKMLCDLIWVTSRIIFTRVRIPQIKGSASVNWPVVWSAHIDKPVLPKVRIDLSMWSYCPPCPRALKSFLSFQACSSVVGNTSKPLFRVVRCNSGFWLLASGFWLLASGLWPLASGLWPLASGLWPIRGCVTNLRNKSIDSTLGNNIKTASRVHLINSSISIR